MDRELKLHLSRVFMVLSSVLFACGTRVGNPKKPDENTKSIKLPTINASIPANDLDENVTTGLKLTATADAGADAISSGVPSGKVIVDSFNQLVEKLNQSEIKIGETFTIKSDQGDIKGHILNATETGFKYAATFCSEGKPFVFLRWTEDESHVVAVRHIDITPYTDNRQRHTNDGTEVKQELVWKKNDPVQLMLFQTRVPPTRQSILKLPVRTVDAFKFRISSEGVAEFTGVSDLRYATDADDGDYAADLRVAGQVRPDKKHFYLGHKSDLPLLCKGEFDEDNQDAPGWCAGLKRRGLTTNDYAILTKNEIDTAWSLIKDMPLTMEADLKDVAFPTEAVCP